MPASDAKALRGEASATLSQDSLEGVAILVRIDRVLLAQFRASTLGLAASVSLLLPAFGGKHMFEGKFTYSQARS